MRAVRKPLSLAAAIAALLLSSGTGGSQTANGVQVSPRARQLHDGAIVIDTHDDTTQRLIYEKGFDIGARAVDGSIDIPRMREGGLDAVFFSIWMPGDVTGTTAVKQALQQIDRVREAVRLHPRDLVLATSAAGIRRAAADRKIAALMGVEGGHMIDEDLGVLRMYAALGVRYMTLTHGLNTPWADSSTDKPAHNGLTAFGKDVVREMNRVGLMVDISHVADKTFYDALDLTRAPVIASHSSARAIANAPRNMSDDMLRALAKNGGVVMINYNAGFISEEFRAASRPADFDARIATIGKKCGMDEACCMEDASKLPRITDALLKKGYSGRDIEKILGGNLLRVMEQVERIGEGSR